MLEPFRLVPRKKAFGSELHIPWRDAWGYALNFWLKSWFRETPYLSVCTLTLEKPEVIIYIQLWRIWGQAELEEPIYQILPAFHLIFGLGLFLFMCNFPLIYNIYYSMKCNIATFSHILVHSMLRIFGLAQMQRLSEPKIILTNGSSDNFNRFSSNEMRA